MVFGWFKKLTKKRAKAGGAELQIDTIGDTLGDYTVDDIQMATRDLESEKRRRRRKIHKDANIIRLNLRKRLTIDDATKFSDVIGKQTPPGELLDQDTVDNMFAQILAEAINEIEQDEYQSRARFTHLSYMQYYKRWQKNSAYHKKLLERYRNCDIGPSAKKPSSNK